MHIEQTACIVWHVHVSSRLYPCGITHATCAPDGAAPPVQPCTLYGSGSGPQRHLFTAAAALFKLTGASAYRAAADEYWAASREEAQQAFLLNWDNVWGLGAAILAGAKDVKGSANSQGYYKEYLATVVANWVECSEGGAAAGVCECAPAPARFADAV